jgi:hypothetical protein
VRLPYRPYQPHRDLAFADLAIKLDMRRDSATAPCDAPREAMTRTRTVVSASAAVALAVAVAGCARAGAGPSRAPAASAPRWRGDFETGNLSQWSFLLNPRGLSVVDAPVAQGRHAARVEIQPGDLWPNGLNRVEVEYKPPKATVAEGRRSCFSWRFLVPVPLSEARHQIGYFESYPSYKQIMSFEVRGQAITFVTRFPEERVHWTAPAAVTPGVWHQIAICALWSADPAVGYADVWFDGVAVVRHGQARTLWDNPNFVQIGILRDVPAAPEVMFLDDAFEDADF